MKIALAQIRSIPHDVEQNIRIHEEWIKKAAAENMDCIVFPELSVTGYEPNAAAGLSKAHQIKAIQHFEHLSKELNITALVGFPTMIKQELHISTLGFTPENSFIYSKQFLHSDEEPFFQPSANAAFWQWKHGRVGLGICYESLLDQHLLPLLEKKIDLYLISVAKTTNGMEKAGNHYSKIAGNNGLHVLVCNAVGNCTDFTNGGGSAVWNREGKQVMRLGKQEEALLCFDTTNESVSIIQ